MKTTLFAFTEDKSELVPPFALMLIAKQLQQHGYDPHIKHLRKSEIDFEKIVADVSDCLFVGFSLLTGNLLKLALALSKAIKETYGNQIAIVWGGIHTTLCPEISLKEDCIDYIIMGEGEESLCRLAEYLRNGKKGDLSTIAGLGFKEGVNLHFNSKIMLNDLTPYSYAWDLIDVERYIQPHHIYKRALPYISSRGCPFNCTFCYNLAFNNRRWRGWSADIVIEDILNLKNAYNIDAIFFYDDYFFANKKRAEKIIRAIDIPWHAELRATDITQNKIRYLKTLKAYSFFFGAESGSPKVLKSLNKKILPKDNLNAAIVGSKEDGIHLRCSFLMFTPDEEYEDVRKTVLLITRMIRNCPSLSIGIGNYTPYPGAELIKKLKEKGWREPDSTHGWSRYHRQLSPKDLRIFNDSYIELVLKQKETASHVISFYQFFNRFKTVDKVLRLALFPFVLLSDFLYCRGILTYPIEAYLFKILKRLKQVLLSSFNIEKHKRT